MGLWNPLGTGMADDNGSPQVPSSTPPTSPANPGLAGFQSGIPPALPAPTGPTEDGQKGQDNSPSKQAELAKPFVDRLKSKMPEWWTDLRTGYTVYHQLVWQNILFYVGMLWIQWDNNRRVWQPAVPEDEWTPQPKINNFAPAIDSITSVFQLPEVEFVPRVEDNMEAHDVAEVANVIAADFIRENALEHDFQNKEGKADLASQLFTMAGNCLTLVRRVKKGTRNIPRIGQVTHTGQQCPQCGYQNTVPVDPSTQPIAPNCPQCGTVLQQLPVPAMGIQKGPDGQPLMDTEDLWTAGCEIINPIYWLPRAGSKGMEGVRYGLLAFRMSLAEIKEEWNFDAKPDNQFLDSMESSWEIALNFYYTGYSSLSQSTKESALVMIAFVQPGKVPDLPEGGVGVMVNEQLIFTMSWEDYCLADEWGLTHGGYLKAPTTFFYRTPAFDVADIQKEINRYEALIALHGMTAAADSLVVDLNSKVSGISGRGDTIIYYRSLGPGTLPPHRLQHGSLDNGIYEQRQKLEDKIQNITGAVNVWRGQQAGSVTAANAISQLRGQAEQMFSKPTNNWKALWVETVRKGVKLKQKVMQPWEISKIMGDGNDIKIAKFKNADLDSLLDAVATSHGLPRTRDEKRNDLLALFDRGALDISDPNVKIRIAELFGETGMEKMFNRDATRARAENDKMAKEGTPIKPMFDIEDLQVHFYIHSEFIKRLEFDELPEPNQQILLEHALETKMALTMLMNLANQAQGGEGAGGGAGSEGGSNAPPAEGGGGAPDGGPHNGSGGGKPKGGTTSKHKPPKASKPGRPGGTNRLAVPTGPQPA